MTLLRPQPSGALEQPGPPRLRLEWSGERTRLVKDRLEIYAFDLAGRPLSWVRGGFTYRRGLDGTTVEIVRVEEGEERWHATRRLPPAEAAERVAEVQGAVREAWPALGGPEPLRAALETDPERESRRFRAIWRPVMILPPDQYRALVVQLTEGCSYNRCSFCTFYQDRPYRPRPPEEFARHVAEAAEFLGPALSWRRGLFLADANAANLPFAALAGALEELRRAFPPVLVGGEPRHPWDFHRVASFLDTFSADRRSVAEWRALARLGLDSLYLGVETGSPEVLRLLRKPGSPGRVVDLVRRLKEAGLKVGVILMTGVGGRALASEHVRRSAELLDQMPLDGNDRVYLSEFEPDPRSHYVREGVADLLDRRECRAQARDLRARLRFPKWPEGPLISPYDVRQFVY